MTMTWSRALPGRFAFPCACLGAFLLSWTASRAAEPGPPIPAAPNTTGDAASHADGIGTATMLADGTSLLQLRAERPGGGLGDAQLRYATGNPHYRAVREHLPALSPGGTVLVPPFP